MDADRSTLLVAALARQLDGCRVIAVGANSPLPAAAALLAKAKFPDRTRVLILGSRTQNEFTDGGRELFDCAAQGRIDAFFLSGGQIDGEANLNLIGIGDYPKLSHRFPGSFGSAYLYYLIPRVILFREEHTSRVLVPEVDFISAPGVTPPDIYRRGGPHSLVTSRCVFTFDLSRRRFRLDSLHPGETTESVGANTGFDFDMPTVPKTTAGLTGPDIELLRGRIADEIAETYPRFAATLARQAA